MQRRGAARLPFATYNQANALAADRDGNTYVTGVSTAASTGNDIVTVQYDRRGRLQRALAFNSHSSKHDDGRAVVADSEGNVYVVGNANSRGNATEIVLIKYSPLENLVARSHLGISLAKESAAEEPKSSAA
jgi:hypothetical protein